MIAEKAADMIKGRQLDPYEPEHGEQGESVVAPTRLRAPLVRGAHSRSMASVAAPPAPAHNLSETAQHQHLHLKPKPQPPPPPVHPQQVRLLCDGRQYNAKDALSCRTTSMEWLARTQLYLSWRLHYGHSFGGGQR